MTTFLTLNDGYRLELVPQTNHAGKHLLMLMWDDHRTQYHITSNSGSMSLNAVMELTAMKLNQKDSRDLRLLLADQAKSTQELQQWLEVVDAVLVY